MRMSTILRRVRMGMRDRGGSEVGRLGAGYGEGPARGGKVHMCCSKKALRRVAANRPLLTELRLELTLVRRLRVLQRLAVAEIML